MRQGEPPSRPAELGLLARYRRPSAARSVWQIVNTSVPLAGLWLLMLFFVDRAYGFTLLLALPTAAFLIRLFIIQHDCGHGAFFASARSSNAIGTIIGVFTLTPYQYWRRIHAIHHATSGNLERRGFGDIDTLTVREYLALGRWARLRYRLYRNPLVLFGVGPAFHFIIKHRLPTLVPPSWKRERLSIHVTNVAVAATVAAMCFAVGPRSFFLVQLPVTLLASSIGVWLFYVQHQFEDAYWQSSADWSYDAAALQGSSYLKMPKVLQFFTGNIGLHHVHHLNARIPNYNLQRAHDENPIFHNVPTISLWDGARAVRLKLWDEQTRKLVTFAQARRATVAQAGQATA